MAVQASDGEGRLNAVLRRVLRPGPSWGSNRVLTASASALIAALVTTGVVALSTSGSAGTTVKDAAATTPAKPHYLLPIAALIQQGAVPPPSLNGDTGTVGVPTGTAPRPTTPQKVDPNRSNITTYRGATGTMTPAGIATLALQRGCSTTQAPIATAVAMAESGGSPSAQGDVTLMTAVWDWSAGLWQIRGLRSERGTGGLRDSIANQRATTNSAAMYVISSGCTNWSPWTTYTRGLYLGYLGVARQAVNYVVSYYKAHGRYPAVAAPDPTAVIPVSTGGGGGGEAIGPASAQSSTPATAKPGATKGAAAPKPSRAAPSTGGAQKPGAGSSGRAATTPAKPSTSKKSTKPTLPLPSLTKPKLPLPTVTVPKLPVPVTTCVLIVCLK